MITIKKKNKINELFTTDGSNIFPYEETEDGYIFSDDNLTEYNVIIDKRSYGSGSNFIEISYYRDNGNHIPQKGEFHTDKAKVLNTVITICKNVIDKLKPFLITFSGNIEYGLADLYKMIIRSLKLKNIYDINEQTINDSVYFSLVKKDFKFIDVGNRILANIPNKGILIIYYEEDGLSFSILTSFEKEITITNFSDIVKHCIPDTENLDINWYDEGQDFIRIQWGVNLFVEQDEIKKVIKHMESIGATFRNIENDDTMVFVNSSKL